MFRLFVKAAFFCLRSVIVFRARVDFFFKTYDLFSFLIRVTSIRGNAGSYDRTQDNAPTDRFPNPPWAVAVSALVKAERHRTPLWCEGGSPTEEIALGDSKQSGLALAYHEAQWKRSATPAFSAGTMRRQGRSTRTRQAPLAGHPVWSKFILPLIHYSDRHLNTNSPA